MSRFSRFGNDLYRGKVSINFTGRRRLWYSISLVLVVVAIASLWIRPLNMGIEFEGGAEYRVSLPADRVSQSLAEQLRDDVAASGVENAANPVVTTSGDEAILVRTETLTTEESDEVVQAILDSTGVSLDDISQSEVGASWGREVANRALTGVAVFLVVVSLFIAAWFREWKMSAAALIALAHDITITIGIYALSGFEVTPATVTGVLTILGFSLYDKVVVFDKIRENTHLMRQAKQSYSEAANLAVNQTLVRSINTSLVAVVPVAGLLYAGVIQLGTGPLKDLALALMVGVMVGAYSSVFLAPRVLVHLKGTEKEIQLAERRAAARRKRAEKYGQVPTFSENMPLYDEESGKRTKAKTKFVAPPDKNAKKAKPTGPATAPARGDEAIGAGRVVPQANRPLKPSGTAKRAQPSRQSRSKRGKK